MAESMETIRAKQLETLKKRAFEQQQAQEEAARAEAQLDETLRFLLSTEAKERLSNVRLANKNLYLKTAQTLLMLYKSGQLNEKISGEQLKKLLEKLSERRETKIVRK